MTDTMSFGCGVQSTAIMTLAGEGHIPMPSKWVFSDPGFESAKTYEHLERCKDYLAKRGAVLDCVTAGNIFDDAIMFAERRQNSDVSRYALIPMFIEKRDGTDGILPRQCTTEYKIEPIEAYHRREVMGLKYRQHAPKVPTVNVWIGISKDEERRASAPGKWAKKEIEIGKDMMGEPIIKEYREWVPCVWQVKSYPMLGYVMYPDRSKQKDERFDFCADWDREDAHEWLKKIWPWPVPRSACICCPYRTNNEWRAMKADEPADFAKAVEFDDRIRKAYATGRQARGELAGVPYMHRTRVPLGLVDFSEPLNDRMGCGGLFSQEPDGICGV